ncbi:catechol 2,3-dioxygenase-like lactoylglutathione lyase family enzyme [Salirhabdus euzebyi]|uniref:Catechol 2,3-dioxygenase-like lactoylglutathione lyase family enzyme n=1 Tax=Salirhabdus euzebyi TaxID=394506 RepID=A0A841Q2Z9_9BACI|nr:DinB family protein [Salirhabdus euzebyi]MBB6452068.1 catechol 2,3-dioxygenase-like lactoylglutathione lyase family enzyme [Salirhabdus euzebyi]
MTTVITKKPNLVLRVNDLNRSLDFYIDTVGWVIDWKNNNDQIVQLKDQFGESTAILTSSKELDVREFLDTAYLDPIPGQRFYFTREALKDFHQSLLKEGIVETNLLVEEGFGQTLLLEDPDGYILAFWEELYLPDNQIVELYKQGPVMLEKALHGLSDADLDLVRAPGKWSIRQTVLHFIDSDITSLHKIKFALAESGREYIRNAYDPNNWESGTKYSSRSITIAVQLFMLQREHVLEMCTSLPDALDRFVLVNGKKEEVRKMIKMIAGHARGHIIQIWETRKVHQIS